MTSGSLGNILLSNVGNLFYSVYVFQLRVGPIWFLHGYNLVSTGLMLIWYLQYEGLPPRLKSFGWQVITRVPALHCCFSMR